MEDISIITLIAAVAAAVTSIVAASVSIWSLYKSGARKVAEYRLAWIERLRGHYAEIVSLRVATGGKPNDEEKAEIIYHVE